MDESSLRDRIKKHVAESMKDKITKGPSSDLTEPTPDNLEFLREIKAIYEKHGALGHELVDLESGYTTGQAYQDVLDALAIAEGRLTAKEEPLTSSDRRQSGHSADDPPTGEVVT